MIVASTVTWLLIWHEEGDTILGPMGLILMKLMEAYTVLLILKVDRVTVVPVELYRKGKCLFISSLCTPPPMLDSNLQVKA